MSFDAFKVARPARGRAASARGGAVHEHRLANGMRILIAERHADPVVAVMLWYRVGSRNEREHEAGVSHFLEHMMFKGAERFGKGEIDRLTTMLGGSNNAFTSCDHTAYWFELASDRWETALEIEADRMRALALDAKEFDAERAVVLEELSMGLDDPWRRLTELVQSTLFLRHPYRRPVIGHADALARLSVREMREYWRRFYHPGNATLVLCGDLDPKDALARARRHFEGLAAGDSFESVDIFRPSETLQLGERRVQMRWDDSAKRLCIAWPTAVVGSADDYALDVLSTLLSSGRLSRLHRRLVVDDELVTSISTQSDTRVENGVFWLFAECAPTVDCAAVEAAIDDELGRLASERVGARELGRARAMIRAADAFDLETASDFAERLGEFAVDADWRLALDGLERTLAIEAAAVRDVARRLLARERRVVGWCLPKNGAAKARAGGRSSAGRRRRGASR